MPPVDGRELSFVLSLINASELTSVIALASVFPLSSTLTTPGSASKLYPVGASTSSK